MQNYINLRPVAKRVVDLSPIIWECGHVRNNGGNFSLIPYNDGWLASFRLFGYYITKERQQYVYTKEMTLENPDQHLFVLLDRNFNFIKRLNLIENTYWKPEGFENERTCLEDMRLCQWGDEIYGASATFYTRNRQFEKMGIEVQKIQVIGDDVRATHIFNSSESGIMGRLKNWMPIPDKPFNYITGTSHRGSQIIDISEKNPALHSIGDYDESKLIRGNTPLVNQGNCHISITHSLEIDKRNGHKCYYNYLVPYGHDLSPVVFSKPFKMTNDEIEFVTTMINDGDDIHIGVTECDCIPYLMTYDKAEFFHAVFPMPKQW